MTDERDDDDAIPVGRVLNPPNEIYLVIGELDGQDVQFKDLAEVTWCADSCFKDDVRYVRDTLIPGDCETRKEKQLRYQVEAARDVINRAVDLMTSEQLGQWTGVRSWLEQSHEDYGDEYD